MKIEKELIKRLNQEFPEDTFTLENDSKNHVGHMGDNGTADTHFIVMIKSELKFLSKDRMDIHKRVNEVTKDLYNAGLHSLSIRFM